MQTYSASLDVAGPGLFAVLGAGLAVVVVGYVLIVLAETLILYFMGWGPLGRALVSAFLMNLASSVLGIFYAPLLVRMNGMVWVVGALILSILVETGVLALMRKAPLRRAVWPVFVCNIVTYVPIALLVLWGAASLGL